MKLNLFKKNMLLSCFSLEEAKRVAWQTSVNQLKVQLHHWTQTGEVVRLKKGLYAFPERVADKTQVARVLYQPACISLEYALNYHGLIPDVPFAITLITPKISRNFSTPFGQFIYHKVRRDLFWGFDTETLMAEKEKALLDYFYLNCGRMEAKDEFWEAMRIQNFDLVNFNKLRTYAKKYHVKKIVSLIQSLEGYKKRDGTG